MDWTGRARVSSGARELFLLYCKIPHWNRSSPNVDGDHLAFPPCPPQWKKNPEVEELKTALCNHIIITYY